MNCNINNGYFMPLEGLWIDQDTCCKSHSPMEILEHSLCEIMDEAKRKC